jgi:hypothetical protein
MGPGLGQARGIDSYEIDAASGRVTFKVSPRWQVQPRAGASRIAVGREFREVFTLGNTVDNRQPACLKSNRTAPKAGVIVLWGQSSGAVVAGNRQYDSDGIEMQLLYSAPEPGCAECDQGTFFQSFAEIRDNLIDGEYRWRDDCSSSGIFLSLGASPHAPPVTAGFGIDISHNQVLHADGFRGGAITAMPTWHQGPAPYRSPLLDNLLIQHNEITGLNDGVAARCGRQDSHPRTAIDLGHSSLAWHTVAYANQCKDAVRPIFSGTQPLKLLCQGTGELSCGCAAPAR